MQLVAYGAQDIYLTGNPQITFFKVVYRRHTNFSMETIEQTINGTPSSNGSSTVTISRNGDLVYKVYVTNAGNTSTTNGSEIVSEVELEIGGQRIDRHYAEWNQIWNELSTPESKAIGLKSMVGDVGTAGTADSTGPLMTQYPLNFWFCRNPGLALPLIALQYHEVKLKFTWGATAAKGVDTNVKVLCDYIYLDTDERRRFAQVSHEYLIEQLQKESFGGSDSQKLNFNHPVKELIWTSQASSGYRKAQLKLNGHDRFSAQESEYFQLRQPFDYHTAVPKQNLPTSAQLSTLDRQTFFVPINENGAGATNDGALSVLLTAEAPATDTNPNEIMYDKSENRLILQAGGTADNAAHATNEGSLLKGDQIAIVCVVGGGGEGAAVGRVFFATLTADSVVGTGADAHTNALVCPITVPTSDGSTSDVFDSDTTDTSQFQVFKVTNGNSAQARTSQMTKKINVYSFGLKPEEHQPSGTCNFSRIDTAKLDFSGGGTAPTANESIYAVNYNVLRVLSGMGGLAFSN